MTFPLHVFSTSMNLTGTIPHSYFILLYFSSLSFIFYTLILLDEFLLNILVIPKHSNT